MVRKLERIIVILLIVSSGFWSSAQEGMWIPSLLEELNEEEMQSMGMEMKAEDIYSIQKSSLKDAVVHFGGFCTGEVISNQGLVLTNHHCGYSRIQSHSTLENNLLENGFWADSFGAELPNPGLYVTFVKEIKEVTDEVLKGVSDEMTEKQRQEKINKNIESYVEEYDLPEFEDVKVKSFYKGNQFFAFITQRFEDIRLVGAPPSSIGKFGADTDNWVWPRHTGDFALFRIYADENNQPAAYSPDNEPYTPRHFFPISLDGVDPGDFTLIFGFPGSTDEYLPALAVEQLVEEINPLRISVRDEALEVLDKAMKADPEIEIKYASKFASIANYWKKWQGENLGLTSVNAVEKIRDTENAFMQKIKMNPDRKEKYGGLLTLLEKIYIQSLPSRKADAVYNEILNRNVEALRIASFCERLISYHENSGEVAYQSFNARLRPYLENLYDDYVAEVDMKVAKELLALYPSLMPQDCLPDLYRDTMLSVEKRVEDAYRRSGIANKDLLKWLEDTSAVALEKIQNDPLYTIYLSFDEKYENEILPDLLETQEPLDSLMRVYMQLQMKFMKDELRLYPDANSTMRVGYGQVQGYTPKDAVKYLHQTHLEGVMQKYVPGDYEFDVPEKLIQLYEEKNYGQYDENGKMPVCFIASNHTTGGNSGSPAIDATGNLIGLNFDRVWEGTMSDYFYDISICRNIMVDVRYILFIIDKYAGADHIIKELKLANPKVMRKR
jgi:hypothetical protein